MPATFCEPALCVGCKSQFIYFFLYLHSFRLFLSSSSRLFTHYSCPWSVIMKVGDLVRDPPFIPLVGCYIRTSEWLLLTKRRKCYSRRYTHRPKKLGQHTLASCADELYGSRPSNGYFFGFQVQGFCIAATSKSKKTSQVVIQLC